VKKRVERVRFRLPEKGEHKIIVTFSDGEVLMLHQGAMVEEVARLARRTKGRTWAYVIHEMAYERAMAAARQPQIVVVELLSELRLAVDRIGYKPDRIQKAPSLSDEVNKQTA
jgi:hypothetical protein